MATNPTDDRRTTTVPATDDRFAVPLRGVAVDRETRCAHWDSALDVVALRFGCCETYYPCDACHDAATDHAAEPWPRDRFDEPAVLCGACGATLTARAYLDGGSEVSHASGSEGQSPSGNRASSGDSRTQSGDDACPHCGAAFNPGCRRHRDRYFEA
ncbi:CHY zinc finger protein [Halorubrum amylolyticum]|uniref:CHY zinc finger protein n=1 Tax=Halorubrum amylolyticum TaxID=2508724 RepID=UPI0010090928|nr:CHY zinc finger protein [Halorubrum amylolyticum]